MKSNKLSNDIETLHTFLVYNHQRYILTPDSRLVEKLIRRLDTKFTKSVSFQKLKETTILDFKVTGDNVIEEHNYCNKGISFLELLANEQGQCINNNIFLIVCEEKCSNKSKFDLLVWSTSLINLHSGSELAGVIYI